MITFVATVLFGKFSTDVLTTLEFTIVACTDLMCRDTEYELSITIFSIFCKNWLVPCKLTIGYR